MNQINPYRHGGEALAFDGFGNRSRDFNGVDDVVDLGQTTDNAIFTASAWLKLKAHDNSAGEGIFGKWQTAAGGSWLIYADAGATPNIKFIVRNGANDAFTIVDSGISASSIVGDWTHIAGVADGTNLTIYINGVSEGSIAYDGTINNPTTAIVIGAYNHTVNPTLHLTEGNIADCRLYNIALTATEISDLYSGTDVQTNLVGHWLTDADNVLDAAGTNHGTNIGSKYSYDNPSPPVEFGRASRSFNGTSDRVTIPASLGAIFTTGDFAISQWFKVEQGVNDFAYSIAEGGDSPSQNKGFGTGIMNGQVYGFIHDGVRLNFLRTGGVYNDGQWHHRVDNFDRDGNWSCYVDGVLDASQDISARSSTITNGHDTNIGMYISSPVNGGGYYEGKLSDVRAYESLLSVGDISDLYAGTDVQTNLVGHWLTDNDDVEDKAGTNDGTNFGSTYSYDNPPMDLVPSRQASRSFDGTSAYIDLGNDASLDFTSTLTMSFWIKPESSHNGAILSKWTSGLSTVFTNAYTCYFGQDAANDRLEFIVQQSNGTRVSLNDSTVLPLSQWSHVVCKADGSNLSVFIDGQSSSSVSYDGTIDVDPVKLLIGKLRQTDSVYTFDGKIADVRLYDTDLTASQILAIYNGTTDRTNLVGQWLTNSDDVLDHAGTNDGTNNNSTYSTDSPS